MQRPNPEYFANFNQALTMQGIAQLYTISIFPFQAELSKLETTDETVLLVDVGAGLGHSTRQIKALLGDVKGRLILQDRPDVVESIKEDLGGIEKMGHDFFTPNPVKAESRLLIAECVLPPAKVNVQDIWMDLSMMMFAGRERTEEQWNEIVTAAGLRLGKVYGMAGTHYGVVEAYLK